LIAFNTLYGDHTALNQARLVAGTLLDYKIAHHFHAYIGDNASNNNKGLVTGLNKFLGINLSMNARIRCAGHILNLIIKATIYSKSIG
ncbi:hypothetical protein K469DRAFT_578695, partial [Zopfia rhizophila CBS 207.26]